MAHKRPISDNVCSNGAKHLKADDNILSLQLNSKLLDETLLSKLAKAWSARENADGEENFGIQIAQYPFCHCTIPDLLQQDDDALDCLREELMNLQFSEKNNDLYKFHQSTEDLKTAKSTYISEFRKLVCSKLRDWLATLTGIPLNETVDMFCAQYMHTDVLLCHDDELEGRRIAYIYYLVDAWTHEDGGALDLFSVDENFQPKEIVKSIIPIRNNLVLFEVSPGSYHQVSEILSEDKMRLSVGGWFHGQPIVRPPLYLEKPRTLHSYGSIDDDVFFDWINPLYLDLGAQGSIQEKFEAESELELPNFLQTDKYEALLDALTSAKMHWTLRGPANKRCYNIAGQQTLPDVVQTCMDLFKSDAMFLLLSNFTGLRLHELANDQSESDQDLGQDADEAGTSSRTADAASTGNECTKKSEGATGCNKNADVPCSAKCRCEVRHWKHGNYSLAHDTDTEGSEFALDLMFYLGCPDWEMDYGGFTSYIAKEEDLELLTVTPEKNSLALVYRDQETLKFVKYLNCQVNKMARQGFYDIHAVYYE